MVENSGIEVGKRPGSRLLRSGVVLFVLGMLLGGYVTLAMWPVLSGLVSGSSHSVPGTFEQELDAGEYLLSVQTSSTSSAGPLTFSRGQAVDVVELSVRSPGGEELPLENGANQFVNRNGDGFTGVAVFTANEVGLYEFRLLTSVETEALVTRSLSSFPILLFILGAVASLLFTLGLVLALVGFFRRQDHNNQEPHGRPRQ